MKFLHSTPLVAVLAGGICFASGCDNAADGEGTLRVSVYGEEFIEDRIPADVVADGWEIQFSKFLVSVGSVEADGMPVEGQYVFDLSQSSGGSGHDFGEIEVPAGTVEHLAYRIGPTTSASGGNASQADIDLMNAMGFGLYIEGTATRYADAVMFAWGIDTDTNYVECETDQRVDDGGEATSQITVHADHLFYDDLELPEPSVRFDLVAGADAEPDGVVTSEELRGVDITGLSNYGVGSADVSDLWAFISAQSTTVGHIDGEGHCEKG